MKLLKFAGTVLLLAGGLLFPIAPMATAQSLPTLSTATLPPTGSAAYPGEMSLEVDATDLDRKVFRVKQRLPVQAGPLALYYPRWLPGAHSPSGQVNELTGLQIRGGGQTLTWTRDTLDVFAFHVTVPTGVQTLDIEFQFVSPLDRSQGSIVVTPDMLGVPWHAVVLYPAGFAATKVNVKATLKLPEGWGFGTALDVAARKGSTIEFQPVSVETLVDSPVFAGRHFQQIDLDPGARAAGRAPVFLNIMADRASQLPANPEHLAAHRALVTQADRVFGSRHFVRYDFLLALSENFSAVGLEHHQSSENGVASNYFTEWAKTANARTLLPHEYTHSWNGKFRRPADLWTPHFNTPMQNSLLWVYEGQTQFWGWVLAARSGLLSPAQARDHLALAAAGLDTRPGRAWRNLQDTTNEPITSGRSRSLNWRDWQRSADYYDEGTLLWIEADMLIRERSNGQRSIDDFARNFFGVEPGRVEPLLYTFDDVMRELDRVQAFDWAAQFRQRLDSTAPGAPLGGLARAGWKLAWSEQPSEYFKLNESRRKVADFSHSIGLEISTDGAQSGRLASVRWGSPAFNAGLGPDATLLAVNGRSYTSELLKEAISEAQTSGKPIELLVKSADLYRTVAVACRDGLRYPTLERIEGTPDRLTELLKPR